MGVIAALAAGFDTVRRRLWLILLPIVLDIGLWLAPKLSIATLVHNLMRELAVPASVSPDALRSLQDSGQLLQQMSQSVNLLSLLASSYLGVPSLLVAEQTSFFGWTRQVIEVRGDLFVIALVLGLGIVGIFFGALYLGLIAQQVRDERSDWRTLGRWLLRYWLRLIGAALVIVLGVSFCSLPVALVMGILGLLSEGLASLLMALFSFAILWILIYLSFVPQAIVFGEDGVLRSLWHSANVVRYSFWSTLGLLVLVNIIIGGLMFIWQRLTASAPGALVAIVGNAYVGTGLTTAVFIFYRDRYRAWRAAIMQQRGQG